MKIRIGIIIFALLLFSLPSDSTIIHWSSIPGWYPLVMPNENSESTYYGLAIDVMEELTSRIGFTSQMSMGIPFSRLLLMLENNDLDMIVGLYFSEERNKIYLYTPPFYSNESRLFIRKDSSSTFNKLEDLKGKIIGKPRGGFYGAIFEEYIAENSSIFSVNYKDQGLNMLNLGRIDYYVSDYLDIMSFLKKNNLNDQIIPLEKSIETVPVHAIISRNSPFVQYYDLISETFNDMLSDGTIDSFISKY